MENVSNIKVLIRGAGEMASGIAYRVHCSGFRVCLTEIPYPLAVSRANSFSDAVFDGSKTVCGITAERVTSLPEMEHSWQKGNIPLFIDSGASINNQLHPEVIVDAIMAKKPTGTTIDDAPLVIGIGPGFYAGKDAHYVIETNDSNGNAGKVISHGEAETNTGIPFKTAGVDYDRVTWAPEAGTFKSNKQIGDSVTKGQVIGRINLVTLPALINGKIRGIIRDGTAVYKGAKLIEIDPVNDEKVFYLIRGKIWNVAGAIVETIKAAGSLVR